jgi:hypothetical protein
MSDFKFVAFVIFLFLVFGAFTALYTTSQVEYLETNDIIAYNTSDVQTAADYDQVADMTEMDTYSEYGTIFMSGLGILMVIVIIRFLRGQ